MIPDLSTLVTDGRLRAAINTGNRALVQQENGELTGVSPALARRLAAELGVEFVPVVYDGAGKVFNDAGGAAWDVAFMAIDPARAVAVSFTRPYHVIEATYAVRADGPIRKVEDADKEGVTILTSSGSAYQLHLSATVAHARLELSGTPGDSFAAFKAGRGDVVAGVRASLNRTFRSDPDYRVLPGVLAKVEQAMVLAHPDDARIAALDDFVARAIESGFVADALRG